MLFLGTKFTERVLQIQVESQKSPVILLDENSSSTFASGSIECLSEGQSSENFLSDGAVNGHGSPNEALSAASEKNDSYFKIRVHAIQCLSILFKYCNKAFTPQSLWLLIFPSILTSPQPNVLAAIENPSRLQEQVKHFCLQDIQNEPTFFFLIKSTEDNASKFRGQVVASITSLVENTDFFSKDILESEQNTSSDMAKFLRIIHYLLVELLVCEPESSNMTQHLFKLCSAILTATPYERMQEPSKLASMLVRNMQLYEQKIEQNLSLKNQAIRTIALSYAI